MMPLLVPLGNGAATEGMDETRLSRADANPAEPRTCCPSRAGLTTAHMSNCGMHASTPSSVSDAVSKERPQIDPPNEPAADYW